ncbi:Serine/threonine-protein kinase PknE [Nocardioides dokdonensis FR1436]|uniref:Serine/threonine-protein kinase PknE n=1 Tax=Nocardioides dokdonensis FR1436 TaxID=1300347 RepID=A0A1A9GKF4_9ACTN|nr:thioredoxin domain-containing protein [Nocardioides dokdonensis]ANH38768.1 Serine/threonine-protein kinase PknE [Nocardioides dokdonensis FR1436]
MSSNKSNAADRTARAQQARAEQERAERRRRLLSIGGVVLAMVLIIGVGFVIQRSRDTSSDVAAPAAGQGEYGVTIGAADAPHDIVVYEDFLCPFCGALEEVSTDDLARLADEGKVTVEYRPFNLLSRIGDYSARATNAFAVVLEESGPETAKAFHDLLFENQPSESGPFPSDADLVALAVEAGAEESDVADGIESGARMDWVEEATRAAQDAGVQGTPTVLLDGEVVNGGSVEEIADALVAGVE